MAMVSMDSKLHLPFIILHSLHSKNNLYKTMTPLEQFNEEVMHDYNEYINNCGVIDVEEVRDFIIDVLAAHKELILKMVREKVPKIKITGEGTYCQTCRQHKAAGECDCIGFNKGVQEFLNNLDTI